MPLALSNSQNDPIWVLDRIPVLVYLLNFIVRGLSVALRRLTYEHDAQVRETVMRIVGKQMHYSVGTIL